jgi:hypothetical protein
VVSLGGKYVLDDNSETPDSQVTTYEFSNFMLVWEHKAGIAVGINNHPWGIAWYGTEGTIMMNDAGWEVIPEKRRNTGAAATRGPRTCKISSTA